MKFYSESKEDVLKELSVNRDRGLSSDDVKSRRDKYGLNEFTRLLSRAVKNRYSEKYLPMPASLNHWQKSAQE